MSSLTRPVIPALLFSAILPASFSVHAADKHKTIVVTASRTPQTANKALASVTVITRKDIEKSQAPTVLEILRLKAGIDVSRTGGKGGEIALFIRGTNSNHVLVLINGVRVGSATTGKTALEHIPLHQVQRIEIVRGPRAALYGSDAVGGVVYITTRKARGTTVKLSAGSYGTRELAVGIGGGKKIRYSINAAIEKTTGFSATNSGSFSHDPDKDGFDSKNFSARLSSPLGVKGQLSLSALQSRDETEFDKGVTDSTNRALSLRFTHLTTGRWTQTLTLANVLDDIVTTSSNSSSITTRRISLDWQNDIRLGKGSLLTAGINLYRDHGINDNLASKVNTFNNRIYNRAAYVSWQKNLGKHNLQISLRQDRHSQFGSKTTGLLGWGTQLSKQLRIWGSVGTAFKAPTLNDLYHPGYDYGSGTQYAGNPNLLPETSKNYELGIKYSSAGGHVLSATLFHNRINNLITFATSFPNQITNIGKADIRGLELVYGFGFKDWGIKANATLQQARNGTSGKTLLRRPDRKLSLTAVRKYGSRGDVSAEWLMVGHHEDFVGFSSGRVGGYGIINLSGRYRPRKGMTVGLRIDNLLDKNYQEAYGYNTPGRSAYITFLYRR